MENHYGHAVLLPVRDLLQETFCNGAVVDGRHFGNQTFRLFRLSSAQQPPGRLQNAPGNGQAPSLSNARLTFRMPEANNNFKKKTTRNHTIYK